MRGSAFYWTVTAGILTYHILPLTYRAMGDEWRLVERPAGSVGSVVFSKDHALVGIAEENHEVRIVEFATGATRGVLKGHTADVGKVVFSPDGRLIVTTSRDGTLRLWNSKTTAQLHQVDVPHCIDLAFSPDGGTLASGHFGKGLIELTLWHLSQSTRLVRYKRVAVDRSPDGKSRSPNRLRFAPDGRKIVFGSSFPNLLDVTDESIKSVAGPDLADGPIVGYRFLPEKGWLVAATYGCRLIVWDAETLTERFRVPYSLSVIHTRVVSMTCVTRSAIVLTTSEYGSLAFWDLDKAKSDQVLVPGLPKVSEHGNILILSDDGSAVAFPADGQIFVGLIKDMKMHTNINNK